MRRSPESVAAERSAHVDEAREEGDARAGARADHAVGWQQWLTPNRRFLWILALLAVVTRLIWVLFVHPPGGYVYSDMRLYVLRAAALAEQGISPSRHLAWQAFGTHYILSIPYFLLGHEPVSVSWFGERPWIVQHVLGAIIFGLCSAGAVVLTYLLALRLFARQWMARAAGIVALCWYPNLSTAGFFLSEPPFLLFNLWTTYCLVRVLQEGKRALAAGVLGGIAFMVRPQSAIFLALAFLIWLINCLRLPRVRLRHIALLAIPLACALSFSLWRFQVHTGYWGGIAENANMNLTAARCHNIVTQAFKHKRLLLKSKRNANTRDGRRVSLPGYRALAKRVPDRAIIGLRPAMRGTTIRFVGYIGDPEIHKRLRAECYRRTGVVEQLRYSVVNLGLQWFIAKQWPTNERGRKYFLPITELYRYLFQVFVLLPSLIGLGGALRRVRADPVRALVAANLLSICVIAAVFFGDPRLRTPYDPYALLLALPVYFALWRWYRARRSAKRSASQEPAAAPEET